MAIQKKIDLYNTGIECEIWRVVNVPIFRDRARVSVAGWLNKMQYDKDLSKTNYLYAQQYDVEDKPEVAEQLDEKGEMEIPFQPAKPDFTDYFSNDALIKSGASPLANGYEYLLTLPEFEGGMRI
jgi:hypothetical protein